MILNRVMGDAAGVVNAKGGRARPEAFRRGSADRLGAMGAMTAGPPAPTGKRSGQGTTVVETYR